MVLGPLNLEMPGLPTLNVTDYLPDEIRQPKRAPLIVNQPRAATSLQNKYAPGGLYDLLTQSGQYTPESLNALRSYDEDRVSRGQAPLTEIQTQKSLQAASTKTQATPTPERSMWNLPMNAIKDLGNILKSLPQLPGALISEGQQLSNIGESISSASNPIAGLLKAPGVRMLPGAFIAGNIAGGTPGELARSPLFTALDVLPIANVAAKSTRVAARAAELAEVAKTLPEGVLPRDVSVAVQQARRPISTALLNKVDAENNIIRNTAGELTDLVRDSRAGMKAREYFGKESRNAVFFVNAAMQRVRGIMGGEIKVPDDTLVPLAREAVEFNDRLLELGIDDAMMPELVDRMRESRYADAPPNMLEAMELTRNWNERTATLLQERNLAVMFDNELYDLQTGIRLREGERSVNRTKSFVDMRGRVETSALYDGTTPASPVTAVQSMIEAFNRPRNQPLPPGVKLSPEERLAGVDNIAKNELSLRHNVMIRELENLGYDTTPLSQAWQYVEGRKPTYNKQTRKQKGKGYPKDPKVYTNLLDEIRANPDLLGKRDIVPLTDTIQALKDKLRDPKIGPAAKTTLDAIRDNNPIGITRGIEMLRRTDMWEQTGVINRLKAIRETQRFIGKSKLSAQSPELLAKQAERFGKVSSEAVPARFIPELDRQTRLRSKERAIAINTVDEAAAITKMADNGDWTSIPGFTDQMYRQIQRESAVEWKRWRDDGFDPIYVHTVTPNKMFSALQPKAGIVPNSISSVKKRSWDMAPGVKNVGLAMTDQMREILSRQHVEIAIKQIVDTMGESEVALRRRYADAARRRSETNPALDFDGHLMQLINEKHKRFDPELEGYFWGSPYLNRLKQDRMFIPKHVATNLKGLAEPKRLLGGILDPITNTFRAATTSLSIRTQLYNVVGNFVATELAKPGATLRNLSQVREWMNDPNLVPDSLKEVIGSQKNTFLDLDREAMGVVNEGVWGYMRGKTLGRLWQGEQAAKVPGKPITRYGDKFRGLVEKSYTLNGKVDDFFRMVNYVDEYNKSVKTGSNVANAERRAIVAVRENMQDWMSMTPMERSVIRSLVPFYGYMGHAMRFVLRYPFDHPLRTEMMAKLAEAELEDQDFLPARFMSMLFVGGVGPQGERGAVNVGPFNPFGEIANFMSVKGVLGATNPVIQTALQMTGVDGGEAELYPSLRYDPQTGRLSTKGTNPITNLLHNTIPQSSVITAMLGVNGEFNDMARRDPAAANRYLASGLTIPMMWREIQVDQEIMKAELARIAAQDKVKNEALKTGNWQEALQYPSLREYLAAIEGLSDEQLAPFQRLTEDQITSITQQTDEMTDLPQFAGVTPLNDQLDALMSAARNNPSGLLMGNLTGQPVPGSSLTNTTGGT